MSQDQETTRKLSEVEHIKAASNYLRGNVAKELAEPTETFSKESVQILKHHGMYQQEDRDRRGKKGPDGKPLSKAYSLMLRVKTPGGQLTCDQFLAELEIADKWAGGTMRITNRQDIQFHWVLKGNVREVIRRINEVQLTTFGACGDVERNVMCCPAPLNTDPVQLANQQLAVRLSNHLLPRTRAYHEIWLTDLETGEKTDCTEVPDSGEAEPLYGRTYLPRKFKTAIARLEDNCVDVYTNDMGFVSIREGDRLLGYNVLVGGGLGVTPSDKDTFPRLADRLTFVKPEEVIGIAEAVIKFQRDFGNREDRKRARLKYVVADWGIERVREKVAEYFGRPLALPLEVEVTGFDDHIGWHEQGDGRWFYGLNVENGRVIDRPDMRLKTALWEVCRRLRPGVRLTPHQSVIFTDIQPADRATLESILRDHGVPLHDEISEVLRWSMSCVALPTCGLAVTESERVLPGIIDQLEGEIAAIGLQKEQFTVRMTGCPNGCGRPYNADIGLVGRTKNKYTIYLGGRLVGDRLGVPYLELVPLEQIVPTLVPVLQLFREYRADGETVGDFCHRVGVDWIREKLGHSKTASPEETAVLEE